MNKLWIIVFIVVLSGCGDGSSNTPTNTDPATPGCNTSDQTAGFMVGSNSGICGPESWEPTAVMFGDSTSLPTGAEARHDLCGLVDLRHNDWNNDGIPMCGDFYSNYSIGAFISHGINDGCALTELDAMRQQFATMPHFNVIAFGTAVHDFQKSPISNPCGRDTPDEFRAYLAAVMDEAQGHADAIIWVDTPPFGPNTAGIPLGEDRIINQIGDELAREHGFYIAEMPLDPSYHLPDDVHFTGEGYAIMGQWISNCILMALNQQETSICHH